MVNGLEIQIRDRLDLDKMFDGPVGTYHLVTEEAINAQISHEKLLPSG